MMIGDVTADAVARLLRCGQLRLRCGPFVIGAASPIARIAENLRLLYADHELVEDSEDFADLHLALAPPRGIRRWLRPQVVFTFGGESPFSPLPLDQAYALFEWSLNWCIASTAYQYVILHAAVLERGGRALVMPGPPGSGKSTLCAALVSRGWRLLSDELTLIEPETRRMVPLPRPISLKNESLAVIRNFAPGAILSEPTRNTAKGMVAHMKVPGADVRRGEDPAEPGWILFPKFTQGADAVLKPRGKAPTVLDLGHNSFNYHVAGNLGFAALSDVVDRSACYDLQYGHLEQVMPLFDQIASPDRRWTS